MTERRRIASGERILARQRARPPIPGSNLPGERLGAAWIYLLPSLELGAVHVEGDPDEAVLRTLASRAQRVTWHAWPAVEAAADEARNGPIDLGVVRRRRQGSLADALGRIVPRLAAGGRVFVEARGTDLADLHETVGGLGLAVEATFDTAPATGELVNATAAGDLAMHQAILARGLYATLGQRTGQWLPRRLPRGMRLVAARAIDRTGTVTRRVGFGGPGPAGPAVDVLLRWATDAGPTAPSGVGRAGPPAYLVDLARAGGADLHSAGWALIARGEYATQKPIFLLATDAPGDVDLVVKTTRSPDYNDRLDVERAALETLVELGDDGWREFTHPSVAFAGQHGGLAFLGERAIAGEPFEALVSDRTDDDALADAVDALIELGSRSALPATGADHAAAVAELVEQFASTWPLAPAERQVLDDDVARLRDLDRLDAVFAHGDPGTWNLLATPDGRVGLLDWEAAEDQAPPGWDLARLIHSYALLRPGGRGRFGRAREHLVAGSPLTARLGEQVGRYRDALGLPTHVMPALIRLAWVGRAVKEINRLHPAELRHGHHARLVRLILRADGPPGWSRLTTGG